MSDGPAFLNWQVHDATMRFVGSVPALRLECARKLVRAKFLRGDYSDVLQDLDDSTLEALAKGMVDRFNSVPSNPPEPSGGAVPPRTGG